jgi:drug/metabolite transporter (DMT)-like permease
MTRPPRDVTTDLGLLTLTLVWGVNFSVVKVLLDRLDPLALNALRFPMAALVLWVLLRRLPKTALQPGHRLRIVTLGLLGNVAYQVAFIVGIDHTLAGNASLLLATSPVWTVMLSALVGHEHPNRWVVIGSTSTLVGMVFVVLGRGESLSLGAGTLLGDGLMVGAALLWAVFTVGSAGAVKVYGSIRVTAWTVWIGTPMLVLIGLPSLLSTDLRTLTAWSWAGITYAGVFSVGVAYLLWYRGVQRLGNSRTAVYSNLVPVAALITAWAWLGEVPTAMQLLGAAVILGGLFLTRWGGYSLRLTSFRSRTPGTPR